MIALKGKQIWPLVLGRARCGGATCKKAGDEGGALQTDGTPAKLGCIATEAN